MGQTVAVGFRVGSLAWSLVLGQKLPSFSNPLIWLTTIETFGSDNRIDVDLPPIPR
ncbi:hypothetical protein RBSH_00607 [Rhodopirellula baltica SH28]|uniref:Uncharacterized protein n=2 Tax=Rhodopirellula baltica TaxID=265606 RepID=F2AY99_RHOBT|nr:hypothetical protein RBWH47_02400 [Rhodopirellula baltica WH47]EKK03866.1 hypothetical protein RBSH_00607 [Rhodopirellula baltica SH28]